MRRRRRPLLLGVAVLLLAGAAGTAVVLRGRDDRPPVGCTATAGGRAYGLDLEQAANAGTIAAVGARRGLPDHAVTVALATALQESKLRNLPYGDLDSVGLFQQRPSQGWGTPEQLLDPVYAASAFYDRLTKVPGWQTRPVAEAAQAVQRSADGSAYAGWEPVAQLLARALTGEVPRGIACAYAADQLPPRDGRPLAEELAAQRGGSAVGTVVSEPAGWATAAWLVAHGAQQRVGAVSFDGWTWTAATGAWTRQGPARPVVSYRLLPSRS